MTKRKLGDYSARKNVSSDKLEYYKDILVKMLNCRTVYDDSFTNEAEFKKFYDVIDENFPILKAKAKRLTFGSGCFVYIINGKNATKNIMLMSHHDVVKETDGWNTEAFNSSIINGAIYARGAIDTKTPLFAILEAVEELLEENYDLVGFNIYIASSNNEEVAGDGMVKASKYFEENNIHFDLVLDEGGAITSGMIPGYNGKSAMIAVHEKSRHLFKCSVKLESNGHSGLISKSDSAVNLLTDFISEVNKKNIYKNTFYPEVKATFKTHAPYMTFPFSFIFKNLGLFSPIIKKIMAKMPQAKDMLTTNIYFTSVFAGDKNNPQIKAKEAETTLFLRTISEEDLYEGLEKIKKIAKKYHVEIEEIERDYCKPSRFDTPQFKLVEEIMHENFPDVLVSPFLLTAGTDARRLTNVSDNILRFAPIDLNKEQFASIHGDNEYIFIENIGQCVCFYKDLIKRYGEIKDE